MERLFWWLWHRSWYRICKQIARTRPSCFWETMLEKNGSFRTSMSCMGVGRKFSRRWQHRHFVHRIQVSDKWTFIKSFTLSIWNTSAQKPSTKIKNYWQLFLACPTLKSKSVVSQAAILEPSYKQTRVWDNPYRAEEQELRQKCSGTEADITNALNAEDSNVGFKGRRARHLPRGAQDEPLELFRV